MPTETATAVPSETPTERPSPSAPTATATPARAALIAIVRSSDGSDLPDGLQVCLDETCRPVVAAIASARLVALAAPSGSQVVFPELEPGTYAVSLRTPSGTVLDATSVTLIAGEQATVTLIYGVQPSAPTPSPSMAATASPTPLPTGTPVVSTLPNTGTGTPDSGGMALIAAMLLAVLAGIAVLGAERARRRKSRTH